MERSSLLLLALFVSACSTPTTPPKPAPTPAPAPAAPAAPVEWRDLPENAGRWRYTPTGGGSLADFVGTDGKVALSIRCLRSERVVTIARAGATPGTVLITTSYAGQSYPGVASANGSVELRLPAADKFLDLLAFSRGRFSVAAPGAALLVVPAWAEPARVIEDCRG